MTSFGLPFRADWLGSFGMADPETGPSPQYTRGDDRERLTQYYDPVLRLDTGADSERKATRRTPRSWRFVARVPLDARGVCIPRAELPAGECAGPLLRRQELVRLTPDHAPGVLRSRGLLDDLFKELLEQGYEPADIGLLGFSQGCLMTLEWGARSALALGAYVGISGYCLDATTLLAERSSSCNAESWLITHGGTTKRSTTKARDSRLPNSSEAGSRCVSKPTTKGTPPTRTMSCPCCGVFSPKG